jgi:3-methyladenine DNA glycosylase AlkC
MAEPFKERLNAAAVQRMATAISNAWPAFDSAVFMADGTRGLDALELKARVEHLAQALRPHLPADFPKAAQILVDSLDAPTTTDALTAEGDTGLRGFVMMAVTRYVSLYGLTHFEPSMAALHAMTQRFSAEFDIRFFLTEHPEATWARLMEWTTDPSVHVRRLCSEGSRPRLPWGKRIPGTIEAPERGLAILERLKDDPDRYVQRSVANHLNDVSKDHPERVLDLARTWLDGASSDRAWTVRHALRGRLKAADPAALSLFGYPDPPQVELVDFTAGTEAAFTGKLPFAFGVVSSADQKVLVDYVVHYVKANKTRTTRVFRIADRAVTAGQRVDYDRVVDFKPVSTRKHYPGQHRVEVRINGKVFAGAEFELLPA